MLTRVDGILVHVRKHEMHGVVDDDDVDFKFFLLLAVNVVFLLSEPVIIFLIKENIFWSVGLFV